MFGVVIVIKRIISLVLSLFIVASAFAAAGAITIDGTDSGNEWRNAEKKAYYNNNNGVEIGMVSCIVDEYNAYFRLQAYDKSIKSAESKAGFIISIDGEEIFRITANICEINSDTDKYNVEVKMSVYDNSSVFCEAKVGIKNGIGPTLNGAVCFIDNDGIRSNVYPFSFANADEMQTAQTEKTTAKKVITEKATKKPTTKKETTKKQTTKKVTTERATFKTTRPQEQKTGYVTTLRSVENGDKYYYNGGNAFVNEDVEKSTTHNAYESVTQPATKIIYYADTDADTYTRGHKLKTAVCVGTGVLFTLLCVWGAAKTKKNKEKANEESDKD